jgi:5-methylcytosine-specific restriction endonuclease McrA
LVDSPIVTDLNILSPVAHSEATKAKIRAAWVERRKTFVPPMKGRRHTAETRQKMRDAWADRTAKPGNRLGVKHTPETRALISQVVRERAVRGPACHSYKDGRLAERRGDRFSAEYKRWRYDVFLRDRFACQVCGDARGGNLVAHHLKGFADFPELRFVVANGITLCEPCHLAHHSGERPLPV